jgi:hypothetical protein
MLGSSAFFACDAAGAELELLELELERDAAEGVEVFS